MRRLLGFTFENMGAACYTASNLAEAVCLLKNDAGIKFVICDSDLPGEGPVTSVAKIRTVRPEVVLVGTSASYRRSAFTALGVKHYLQKPWRIRDLIEMLEQDSGA